MSTYEPGAFGGKAGDVFGELVLVDKVKCDDPSDPRLMIGPALRSVAATACP